MLSGDWFAGWEPYLKDHAPGRVSLMNRAAILDLFVFGRPVVNDIVISDSTVNNDAGGSGRVLLNFNGYTALDRKRPPYSRPGWLTA
jgi:hypothetical protein